MNLKESFRYQNLLETLMRNASNSIQSRNHCLEVTKTHYCSKVNPEAEDIVEAVELEEFFSNDDVIGFMEWLILEREKLTKAIGVAKASVGFDIDAAVETNKFRQTVNASIKDMLRYPPSKHIEQGRGYKFNVEGNQMPYYYEIEVVSKEAYNRDAAKTLMRSIIMEADKTSSEIDSAMINTVVDYEPRFDINDSFEDVMTGFLRERER